MEGQRGFSSNEMLVALVIIGFLASLTYPLFLPVIEMAEALIAEKYLFGAVKECQTGLVNAENYPIYTLPPQSVGIGLINNRRFQFLYSGIEGECLNAFNGNILTATRTRGEERLPIYSLNINLVTGVKSTEGDIPSWLDWWEGVYSPIIPENDPLLE